MKIDPYYQRQKCSPGIAVSDAATAATPASAVEAAAAAARRCRPTALAAACRGHLGTRNYLRPSPGHDSYAWLLLFLSELKKTFRTVSSYITPLRRKNNTSRQPNGTLMLSENENSRNGTKVYRGVGKGGDKGACPPEIPMLKNGGFWLTHYCSGY